MQQQKFSLVFSNWFYRVTTVQQRLFALVLIIGAVCGLTAVLFDLAIHFTESYLVAPMQQLTGWKQVFYTLTVPSFGALLVGLILYYLVPEARGSGIPQVKVAYEVTKGHIPFKVVVGKFITGVLSIGTGSSLGREGPTVHICSGIASILGKAITIPEEERVNLLTVGSAAGIAAAFNAPIAGITFTLEELVGNFSGRIHLSTLILASVIASTVERSILGTHPVFTVPAYGLNNYWELLFYALLGFLGGFVALGFSQGLLKLRYFFQYLTKVPVWLRPAIGGFVVGLIALFIFRLTNIGGIAGIGYQTLSNTLDADDIGLKILLLLLVGKFVATIFCYASGGSGGIFSPILFIGGMLGGSVGYLDQILLHGDKTIPGAFALVGMSTVFAGVIRTPITAILIIFEMTGSYSIVLPLMIASMISYLVASHYQPKAIYEALLQQDNIHLPQEPTSLNHLLSTIPVSEVMKVSPITLHTNDLIEDVFVKVKHFDFQYYPVLNTQQECIGIVSFSKIREAYDSYQVKAKVEFITDHSLIHLHPDQGLDIALAKFGQTQNQILPVINRLNTHEVVGIVDIQDIIHKQIKLLKYQEEEPEFCEIVDSSLTDLKTT